MKETQNKPAYIIRVSTKSVFLITALLVLWGVSLGGVWIFAKNRFSQSLGGTPPQTNNGNNGNIFPLLNPRLASPSFDEPEERRAKFFVTLIPLREKLFSYLADKKDNAAFYVEDLNTGAWSGWQERTEFIAASILKVPVAIGVMNKIDEGAWTMETTFPMDVRYKDKSFGSLWQADDGTPLSVSRLLEEMLQYSDNTAANILFDQMPDAERDDVYVHIGLENPESPLQKSPSQPLFRKLSARNLATIFRALYNATYLTRRSSEYLTELLTETKFNKYISTDIPPNIKVAHKIASFSLSDPASPKNYHDCGIVYLPDHPYLYCLMTRDLSAADAQEVIVEMGNIIYHHFINPQ